MCDEGARRSAPLSVALCKQPDDVINFDTRYRPAAYSSYPYGHAIQDQSGQHWDANSLSTWFG